MRFRLVLQQLPLFPNEPLLGEALEVPAIGGLRRDWRLFADVHNLTEREREIAELLRFAKTDQQIASQIKCSPRTVGTHMLRVRSKLQTDSRTEVAMLVVGGAKCICHPDWLDSGVVQSVRAEAV